MPKAVFKKIFLITAIVLSVLPVLVTFSSIITGLVNKLAWYVWLQKIAVPFEAKLVAALVRLVGVEAFVSPGYYFSMILKLRNGAFSGVTIEWNCLGWQSMIILGMTLITGLRGRYTLLSKAETVLFGLLGTFLSNLLRMAIIVILSYYWNRVAAMIIHDYFASFVALIWMIFFWWFSYSYVLEKRDS